MINESLGELSLGFKRLKIKIENNSKEDIGNIRVIWQKMGEDIPIRVDANQGYSLCDALNLLPKIEKYDIELFEQPISSYNLEGLARIRNNTKYSFNG